MDHATAARRRRSGARIVVTLLVLAGLAVLADIGAAAVAESVVARQMREQLGLADDPSVRINGFPFVTQAVSGRYGSVDVAAQRVAVGELRELEVTAQLRDVDAPLGMLLGPGPKTLRVDEAEGAVRIPPDDLERLLPGVERVRIESLDAAALADAAEDGDARLAELDPDTTARFVGTTAVLGEEVEVAVVATLGLVEGQAQITPVDVRLGGEAPDLPAAVRRELTQLFTVRVDPGALPLQVTPTQLRVRDGALEVGGTAGGLVLGG
jgi:hypothetical protein